MIAIDPANVRAMRATAFRLVIRIEFRQKL
jgi:hypothetical protein